MRELLLFTARPIQIHSSANLCLLERLVIISIPVLITSDFNIHVDVANDPSMVRFLDLLNVFNLKQHINVSTHRSGKALDLIITREDDKIASNFCVHCVL